MVKLIKINGGLTNQNIGESNIFLNSNRYFTNNQFENGLSYNILNEEDILLELDNNILFFNIKNTIIDELKFNDHNELINYLFNNV
jgi:hypothetical protein